jgi:hypothetical protein
VETSEDFGSQGNLPSHPELLDWLASDFREQGWSMKQLCKIIVLSATYQQDSLTDELKQKLDPENRLWSRGARYRLSGEQIRDLALSTSGLLSSKMYGPPVRPPQPRTGLNAAFGGSLDWEPSAGEDRYRRAVYTLIRRTNLYPSLMAFDATNRTTCTARRILTNTPVAAFVTLNDPAFIECAQALAQRVLAEKLNASISEKIAYAFQLVVSRDPSPVEEQEIANLLEQLTQQYQGNEEAAQQMATSEPGGANPPTEVDLPTLAAWTVVANVLLNLDESLTRN